VTASGREPYDLARRIAALDQLSGGRAAGPASLVPAFTLPRSPQGRPVALRDADQLAPFAYPTDGTAGVAPDVVIIGAPTTRGSTHSHALVLARLDWRPDTSDALGDSGAPDALSFPPATRQTAPREQPGAGETFAESAAALAARLDSLVRSGTVDGFVLRPAPEPGGRGLDPFVDGVVPLLQERGTLRTAYRGTTLREHLELPRPAWKG
jgi:alkanesulfonate monooxygenase SsuD/methylene tetrahydromethanopterin reductase-like flavin-dependent oxidoreductase (luciferase family)